MTRNKIKVSVILFVYNAEKYLKKCIDSIINQTLNDIEIIVIDDGSTDTTLTLIKDYAQKDGRIRIFFQNRKGINIARNKGIETAQGKYLFFVNFDDYCEINLLEKLYNVAILKKSDFVFSDYKGYENSDTELKYYSILDINSFNKNFNKENIFKYLEKITWGILYKAELIKHNHILYSKDLKSMEDILFYYLACYYAQKITYSPKIYYYHHFKNENTLDRTSINIIEFMKGIKACLKFLKNKEVRDKLCILSMVYHYLSVIISYVKRLCFPNQHHVMNFLKEELIKFKTENLIFHRDLNSLMEDIVNTETWNKENLKEVPIVLIGNEEYALYSCVTIQSIINNANKNLFYDIYFLYSELSNEAKNILLAFSSKNVSVTCIDISKEVSGKYLFTYGHITKESYYRFLIPIIFSGYNRVIYLDGDIILQDDVAKLLNYDIENMAIGAIRNPLTEDLSKYVESTLYLQSTNYVNSGVIIYNIPYWIKNEISQQCWSISSSFSSEKIFFGDQDILNVICKNKIYFIPNNWNIIRHEYSKISTYRKSIDSYNLIHFSSMEKPWNNINCEFAHLWWKIARVTPVYEKIIQLNKHNLSKNNTINYSLEDYLKIKYSSLWDENYYKCIYHIAGTDCLHHYLTTGWKIGYNPSVNFNTISYLAANEDVRNAKCNPLWHYVLWGKKEERSLGTFFDQNKNFYYDEPSFFDKLLCLLKNKKPLVSVFITNYNEYVQHTLDSLLNQTYRNFEIIMLDNGSIAHDAPMLQAYATKYPQLHLFQYPQGQNRGGAETIKFGLAQAKGTYIAFCKAGDFWVSSHLEEKIKLINSFSFVNIISNAISLFGDLDRIGEEINQIHQNINSSLIRTKNSPSFYQENIIPTLSACMVKKRILEQCDFRIFSHAELDWCFWQQILMRYPLFYVNKKITYWRMSKKSSDMNTSNLISMKCATEGKIKIACLLYNKYPFKMKKLKRYIISHYKNLPFFSVICPTYNRDYCLFDAIDSLLQQTYQNFELIIMDDGSTDQTKAILYQKYKNELKSEKIRYFYTFHVGQTSARNIALKKVRYQWITYLDSDNIMVSSFLENFALAICQNHKNNFFFSQYYLMHKKKIMSHSFNYEELLKDNYIDIGTIVHSRRLYDNLGGFNEALTTDEDYDLILRYTRENPPIFIPQVLLLYNDSNLDLSRVSMRLDHEKNYSMLQKIPQIFLSRTAKIIGNTFLKIRPKGKTVLLITDGLNLTGVALFLLSVAQIFKKNDYEIITLSHRDGELKACFQELGLLFISQNINFNYILSTIADILFILDCNSYKEYLLISEIKPVIWYLSNYLPNNVASCSSLRKSEEIFVFSEYSKSQLFSYNNNIHVLEPGIQDNYRNKHIQIQPLVFAVIGEICHQKGQDLLIKVISKIPLSMRKNVKFYILGEGDKEFLENLKKYNCNEVSFFSTPHNKENLINFYEQISCLIIPSRDDFTSSVAIEAMMMGRPIITSDHVGEKYLVNNKNGFIFKSEDEDELNKILINIINYPDQLYPMEQEARATYLKYNSMDKFEDRILTLIQKISQK